MMNIGAFVLLFCAASSAVDAAVGGRFRRANRCLPKTMDRMFHVTPTDTGFDIQVSAVPRGYRCKGIAKYIIRWTPEGEETQTKEIESPEEFSRITGLEPWTKINIYAHLVYERNPNEDYEEDEHTPMVEKEIWTLKGTPSPPRNFVVAEMKEEGAQLTWDPPATPHGPVDGYRYQLCAVDKECGSNPEKRCKMENVVRDRVLTLSELRPFRYYDVTLQAFNEVEKKKLLSDPVKVCFRFGTKSIKPLEHVNVQCENEPNRISVSWDLPKEEMSEIFDAYVVQVTGKKAGKPNIDIVKTVNKSSACGDTKCTAEVQDLKAEFEYEVSLGPHVEDIGPFVESYVVRRCTLRPSAPPPPSKEPTKIENAALKKSEAEFAFWKDMYNDDNGDVTHYDVLVAEGEEIEKCDQPTVWKDAHSKSPVSCYFATPPLWTPFTKGPGAGESMTCTTNADYVQCVLGSDTKCGEDRCNGPLKEGISYAVRIRGHTAGGSTDSAVLHITGGKKSGVTRIRSEGCMAFVILLLPLAFTQVLLQDRWHWSQCA